MRFWYHKPSVLAYLLYPLSLLYKAVIFCRAILYRAGIKRVTYFPVPVIVVGNITVGGSGKSPLVAWLVDYFKQQGHHPGIVARGYRGKARTWPQLVTSSSDPRQVGDEPVMLVRQTDSPMVVSPDRVQAARYLLEHFNCTVIISDDGLQHTALGRDIEIAVVDGERRMGNEMCLPAGPLREPLSRLNKVDCILVNGSALPGEIAFCLEAQQAYLIEAPQQQKSLSSLGSKPIHAIAGIGHPNRFFDQLRASGLNVIEHAFPDHHQFQASDIHFNDDLLVIMTEKDAVKCEPFVSSRHWCLPVKAVLPDAFKDFLCSRM